jgi:hypothetical protein
LDQFVFSDGNDFLILAVLLNWLLCG